MKSERLYGRFCLAVAVPHGGLVLLLSAYLFWVFPNSAYAGAYFEDEYLGLTQAELHAKLGPPHAVRDRKSALRVFRYYSPGAWEKFYKMMIGPHNGEDVYNYKREGIDVRYSFGYVQDLNDTSDSPILYVSLVDIEFSPSVPLEKVPALVPEFQPPSDPAAPAFRSNNWLLLFKGPSSPAARSIVRERDKERLDWSLAFQIFSLEGLSEYFTLQVPIDRMEISAQSIALVRQRQRLTHEVTLNPFSQEFARRPPPSSSTKKPPVPKYAE